MRADSQDESLAFLAASIQLLPDTERERLYAQALIVREASVWHNLVVSESHLILVPTFDGADVGSAVRGGHRVFVPLAREHAAVYGAIDLPRIRREAAKQALRGAGVQEGRAENLATLARRSLASMRRSIGAGLEQPAWASPKEARTLIPALLAGRWDEREEGDRKVIEGLAERPYGEIVASLVRWVQSSDPPIRQDGTTWLLVSREDAWALLSRCFIADDINRFLSAVVTVLGALDPALELPRDHQWMASAFGKGRPHSRVLREGLAETLAVMATRSGSTLLPTAKSGQFHASVAVAQLLSAANSDATGNRWDSLSDVLPLLAEAAPAEFLNGVELGLAGDNPVILTLFKDADDASAVTGHSPHTGLLWALEGLAWSSEYLSHVAALLARLARLDPGGRLGSRLARSLREIFLFWHPQTNATVSQRMEILDSLRTREPEAAWKLLIGLLPKHNDVTTRTHEPRWREWKHDDDYVVTDVERLEGTLSTAQLVLQDVGTSGHRWRDVIEAIDMLPTDSRRRWPDWSN